jgi:hypothetical protein
MRTDSCAYLKMVVRQRTGSLRIGCRTCRFHVGGGSRGVDFV